MGQADKQAVSIMGQRHTLYFLSNCNIRWKLLDLSSSSVLRSISAMAVLGISPTPYGENRMSISTKTPGLATGKNV